jgi:glutathione synthase/RimK-type ligase-like ATP-grasp enzyme
MQEIILLTDYQNRFESRHGDRPYRSGMDKEILKGYFSDHGYEARFMKFSEVDFEKEDFRGHHVLYTSSEDFGYHYKDYIEDIILGLELQGAHVIPAFKYLRANNNKVFMEILRNLMNVEEFNNIGTYPTGTIEDLLGKRDQLENRMVIKTAQGATGSGVFLSKNIGHLFKIARRISRTRYPWSELWDLGRSFKHRGYRRESLHRRKFIVQKFIENLKNDWKIYIFGDKYYIFYRPILKKRKFKASGGGYHNYFYGREARIPGGIFDFAQTVFNALDVPRASLDIAFDGSQFYLLEFQALYFGTTGVLLSDEYYIQENDSWIAQKNNPDIEKVYVESIIHYLSRRRS